MLDGIGVKRETYVSLFFFLDNTILINLHMTFFDKGLSLNLDKGDFYEVFTLNDQSIRFREVARLLCKQIRIVRNSTK